MAVGPQGALFALGMLPAEVERKRRRRGASCPGGMGSAAGWRFRVFFVDSRNAARKPAKNRQVQQGREQSGPERPICVSCPQTRRKNNHGCRVRKRLHQPKVAPAICNEEIEAEAAISVSRSGDNLLGCVCHPGRRAHRTPGTAHQLSFRSELVEERFQGRVLLKHGGFDGFAHGLAGFAACLG
jgi:hypothetical protein